MHSIIEFLLLPSLSLVHSSYIAIFRLARPLGAVTSAQRLLSTSTSAHRLLSPAPGGRCHQRPAAAVHFRQRLAAAVTSASAQKPRLPFTQRVNGLRHTLPTYLEGEAHSWSNKESERENWNT